MKVTLLEYTPNAKELLIFTKRTRRMADAGGYQEILSLPKGEKDKELEYVFGTIASSWEFVDYVFMIEGVTRAFTHQLVRHRTGTSFAQQAQRIANMSDFEYLATGECNNSHQYHETMEAIKEGYSSMIQDGIDAQDARGVLPTNILTAIAFKANLRTLNGIMNTRLCIRAQGEFQKVARAIKKEVENVHPWASKVLLPFCLEWGACKFPNFPDCPVKNNHPWLGRQNMDDARECWEHNIGTDYQPL